MVAIDLNYMLVVQAITCGVLATYSGVYIGAVHGEQISQLVQ